jgi:hypothetical protein
VRQLGVNFKNLDEAAGYLAAIIDGEGSVDKGTPALKRRKGIRITNTDFELIDACEKACHLLGIHYIIGHAPPAQPRYRRQRHLSILRLADLKLVWALVPFRHIEKRRRLQATLDYYATRPKSYHFFDRKPTREHIEQLYWQERLSSPQVAERLGCSAHQVLYWLRGYGIKARSRSEGAKNALAMGRAKLPTP